MDLAIDTQEDSDYLACTITGKWVTKELTEFVNRIAAEAKKRGQNRIFADMSSVEGPPPEMDRFFMGKHVASALPGIRIAVIYRKVYANKFFEDTAVNRGAFIKVFPDKEAALQWLTRGQSSKPKIDDSPTTPV